MGQTFRNEWFYEHINLEQDDYEYENEFANTLWEIEDIPKQVPIYIWYGNNADEQTGLRFLLYLLRDKTNDVYLINSTELYKKYKTPKFKGQQNLAWSFTSLGLFFVTFLDNLIRGPLGDELGWSGYASNETMIKIKFHYLSWAMLGDSDPNSYTI